MREYNSSNPRHVLASALAHECGKPESEALYRKQSVARLATIAAARLCDRVEAARLPVLRTCGDCGWEAFADGIGRGFCTHPEQADGNDDGTCYTPDAEGAPPPTWCPLRQDAPGGQR